mmetsp:Transcript_21645/g.54479  ORF Transcript_21645/g.54479 Transcript_21645/m.54479 type:complete len:393 (+) Transcript_21645:510-1688(+)
MERRRPRSAGPACAAPRHLRALHDVPDKRPAWSGLRLRGSSGRSACGSGALGFAARGALRLRRRSTAAQEALSQDTWRCCPARSRPARRGFGGDKVRVIVRVAFPLRRTLAIAGPLLWQLHCPPRRQPLRDRALHHSAAPALPRLPACAQLPRLCLQPLQPLHARQHVLKVGVWLRGGCFPCRRLRGSSSGRRGAMHALLVLLLDVNVPVVVDRHIGGHLQLLLQQLHALPAAGGLALEDVHAALQDVGRLRRSACGINLASEVHSQLVGVDKAARHKRARAERHHHPVARALRQARHHVAKLTVPLQRGAQRIEQLLLGAERLVHVFSPRPCSLQFVASSTGRRLLVRMHRHCHSHVRGRSGANDNRSAIGALLALCSESVSDYGDDGASV